MSLLKHDNSETTAPPPPPPHVTPSALIFFSVAVIVFCFVGFTVVFFCRCFFMNMSTSGTTRLTPNASPFRGLDPDLLLAFPTFLYATVKDLRKEKKYSLECAICLLEFDDDSMLRLLTTCYHVFHKECIDLWLRSHKTCPVCRTDLESPTDNDTQKPQELGADNVEEETGEHVCIDVKEGDGDGEGVSTSVSMQEQEQEQKFARSHSTGHSVVMVRGRGEGRDGDKYTLRLPEHVALNIVRGGHNYSKSCSSYKDVARVPPPCSNCGHVQTLFDTSSRSAAKTN